MKFSVLLYGGEGDDVWDREIAIDGCDIDDAFAQATSKALAMGGAVYYIAQNDWPAWTQNPPQRAGLYWLWQGEDQTPFPVTVMLSGTSGKCFVSAGQWGWNRHQEFEELSGAWWMPCTEPAPPTTTS